MNSREATTVTILDAAERITQAVGYNGLSFRDVAAAAGIRSASVHYHFPTKGQLGAALARRYADRLVEHLREAEAQGLDARQLLEKYVAVFRSNLEHDGKMCLCGMLAAEIDAIPAEVRAEVRRFIELNVNWLSTVLAKAASQTAADATSFRNRAQALFGALEGAMLVARAMGDVAVFDAIALELQRAGLMAAHG